MLITLLSKAVEQSIAPYLKTFREKVPFHHSTVIEGVIKKPLKYILLKILALLQGIKVAGSLKALSLIDLINMNFIIKNKFKKSCNCEL